MAQNSISATNSVQACENTIDLEPFREQGLFSCALAKLVSTVFIYAGSVYLLITQKPRTECKWDKYYLIFLQQRHGGLPLKEARSDASCGGDLCLIPDKNI